MGPLPNNPLRELRGWRSRVWWETIASIPAAQRSIGETKRRRTGPVRLWEDFIIEGCGNHWRDKREACTEPEEWSHIYTSAIRQITYKYKLPHAPATAMSGQKQKTQNKDEESEPRAAFVNCDLESGPGLTVVGDCQSLTQVINGEAVLANPELAPLCTRVTDKLVDLFKLTNSLHTINDLIAWRPRHLNQIADAAANKCMNNMTSFINWVDPLPSVNTIKQLRLVGFFDGGLRRNKDGTAIRNTAATGWAIFALIGREAWCLGGGGTLITSHAHGSFGAESFALEELVASLKYVCSHAGIDNNSWKTRPIDYTLENIVDTRRINVSMA